MERLKPKCLSEVQKIYLLIGSECNTNCRHCKLNPIKSCHNTGTDYQGLTQKTKEFIVKWHNARKDGQIMFYGGEPLVYWEKIKNIILELEDAGITVQYRFNSNGLLLNKEIVDFCNEHNIRFVLSYDGPNPLAVRTKVPSKEQLELFLQINNRAVNSLYNALNEDMVSAIKMLEEQFTNTLISCSRTYVIDKDMPKNIWNYKNIEKSVRDMFDFARSGNRTAQRWFFEKMQRLENWDREEYLNTRFTGCGVGVTNLSIDLEGNIIRCHNDVKKVADVSMSISDIYEAHKREFSFPKNCSTCKTLDLCRGVCAISALNDEGTEYLSCNHMREYWENVRYYGSKLLNEGLDIKVPQDGKKYELVKYDDGTYELKAVM